METFLASVGSSVVGERTRAESVAEILEQILNSWDGKRPVSAQPLFDQFERLHGKDVAAAAALDLKAIAEKSGVLVDLPKHLKTLRLQERQELTARYHPRALASAPEAVVPTSSSRSSSAASPSAAETSAPDGTVTKPARARVVGVPTALAAVALVAYVIARFTVLQEDDGAEPRWDVAVLPPDPAGLPCVSVRGAGDVVECTLPLAVYSTMSKTDFDARALRTQRAVIATGKKRLRVRTDDSVVRGAR